MIHRPEDTQDETAPLTSWKDTSCGQVSENGWKNISEDVPHVNRTRRARTPYEFHPSVYRPKKEPFPSRQWPWTSSRIYPPVEATMPFSPLWTMVAPEWCSSYPVKLPFPEKAWQLSITNMCTTGLDYQPKSSRTETPASRHISPRHYVNASA